MNAGCRALELVDPVQGARVPLHVLYPTRAAARTETFGRYPLEVARDAPVAGEGLLLVALSHGNGGTPWTYRGLAAHLARSGFAVLMIEHPGNSRSDNSLADTPANLGNRPRHLRLALDAAFAEATLAPHIQAGRAAAIGHSIGGYTALAAAGGHPLALPDQTPDRVAHPVPVDPDPRLSALVLLAPALPWLMAPGALADVRIPLMVRTAELDRLAPPAFVEQVLGNLPSGTPLDYGVVPGAGHFAFQAPFPPEMVSPDFPPSQDPPGFDRASYQAVLHEQVHRFLQDAA
jgi:predicted dienelactone hydrolase